MIVEHRRIARALIKRDADVAVGGGVLAHTDPSHLDLLDLLRRP